MEKTYPSENQKPGIAIFHYSGPPNTSGVDLIIRDQARLLRWHNYKVSIVAGVAKQFRKDIPVYIINRMHPQHPLVKSALEELGQGIVSKNFKRLENSLYLTIKKYITTNNIGACILHNLFTRPYNMPLTAACARLIQDLPDVKFIAWVHDVVFYKEPGTAFSQEFGSQYPWNLLVNPIPRLNYVCVSDFLKNDLLAAFNNKQPDQIIVIPNSFDVEKFFGLSPAMRVLYHDINGLEADFIACIPVRAIPRKNLELAIDIARAMIDKKVKFKLLLTANTDYKREENLIYYNNLKKKVEDLGLTQSVFFLEEYFQRFATPKKPAPVIPITELYLISDFLLLTSRVEGFGLPLLEAGLMRCPIFAADIPPLREIGTTNIHYFNLEMTPDQIAEFILENLRRMPQSYFYRKVIRQFSLHATFQKLFLPLVEPVTRPKSNISSQT